MLLGGVLGAGSLGDIWGCSCRLWGLMEAPGKSSGWAQRGEELGVRVQMVPPRPTLRLSLEASHTSSSNALL